MLKIIIEAGLLVNQVRSEKEMEPEPLDLISQDTANMLQGYLAQHGVQTILQDSTGGAWLTTKSIPYEEGKISFVPHEPYKEKRKIRFVIVCSAKTWPEVIVRVISHTEDYYTEDFIAYEHVDISDGFEGVLDIYNQYAGDYRV